MAGYTAIYCVGGAGGYEGADGINPILFQIWQGDGNRQWLEVHYFRDDIQPIGNIRTLIPRAPNDPNMLLDACLAFFPQHFAACSALVEAQNALRTADSLDFGSSANAIPPSWNQLRIEAAPLLAQLFIVRGELQPVRLEMLLPVATFAVTSDSGSAAGEAEYHPEPAPHVESLHAPDDIGNDANKELFGDHDKGEDVGPVG